MVSYFESNTSWQVKFILGLVIFSLSLPREQQTTIEFFVTVHKQVRAECCDTVPKSGTAFMVVSSLSHKLDFMFEKNSTGRDKNCFCHSLRTTRAYFNLGALSV